MGDEPVVESHRGAFGDYGGEERAFIDRTFREKIVLVGVSLPSGSPEATEAALDELTALVDTAGADAVARVVQRRDAPDPATFVGKGKATEIRNETIAALEAMGIPIEYHHHEVGPSQHEIDMRFSAALEMADHTLTYRLIVKEIAAKNGVYATTNFPVNTLAYIIGITQSSKQVKHHGSRMRLLCRVLKKFLIRGRDFIEGNL